MTWRSRINPGIRDHLELQILNASRHRKAYSEAKNPSIAQLWCAIANLSKQNFDLKLKISYLEKLLKDSLQKKPKKRKKAKKKTSKKKTTKKKRLKKAVKRL